MAQKCPKTHQHFNTQTLLIVKNLLSFQNFGFGFGLGPGQGQGLVPFPGLFHIWYQCTGKVSVSGSTNWLENKHLHILDLS